MVRRFAAVLPLVTLSVGSASAIGPQTAPAAIEACAFGSNEIRVFWNHPTNATGGTFHIYRDGKDIATVAGDQSVYVDTFVMPGRAYRYNVAHVDSGGITTLGREYIERSYPVLPDVTVCDVLVVGANSAGVSSAVTAARYGLNVVMLEENRRIGGMAANGLGASDIRKGEHASGFFQEFRNRVKAIYGEGEGLKYEPRVAQQAIKELVWAEPRLVVHREVRPIRVSHRNGIISQVFAEHVPNGRRIRFIPRFVVDATECGDVAAWSGAKFRVGREPRSEREPHAGVIYYDRASDSRMPGSTGRGDKRIQAYSYLMTVKDYGEGVDRTIPMPSGYDANKYKGAPKWDISWNATSGKLPDDKYEINQHPHGGDLQGTNYSYPTASYEERRRMEKEFRDHALGYLYFMQTEQGKKNLGLSEDDYRDSDGWPPLLYIREARRFESDVVIDQTDILNARKIARANAIGIGDYAMDSHATQPAPEFNHYSPNPKHMGEGEFYLPQYTPWHQIPYHIMIPKGYSNLFTPTAVSATHVAYGTYRMEPVRMHFGAAAGIAAYICMNYAVIPRDVPVRQIQLELLKHRPGTFANPAMDEPASVPTYLYLFSDVTPETPKLRAIQWLAARGFWPNPEPSPRNARTVMDSAAFRPDEPLTVDELVRITGVMTARVGPPKISPAFTSGVVTRAMAATWMANYLGWTGPPSRNTYVDLSSTHSAHAAAEALKESAIDSRLWDGEKAFAPDGKLYFRAEEPITRAQFAELVWLMNMHFGPLWEDHPVDREPIRVNP